jgi:predicted transcriptional regulator
MQEYMDEIRRSGNGQSASEWFVDEMNRSTERVRQADISVQSVLQRYSSMQKMMVEQQDISNEDPDEEAVLVSLSDDYEYEIQENMSEPEPEDTILLTDVSYHEITE